MDETIKRIQDIDAGWDALNGLVHEGRIEYVGRQEELDTDPENKGVRLDVYVRDGRGTVYDVEMQSSDTRELPQRTRYYHALMALDQIGRGERYSRLKDAYVIFICDFDPFGDGRRVYSFENMCHGDPVRLLGDGAKTVFLAATAPHGDNVSDRLNELLDYVASGAVSGELSERLDAEVACVLDNKKWRLEYMIQQVREQLSYDRGEAAGYERGEAVGYEKGEAAGLARGEAAGLAKGEAAGLERGREEGAARLSSCLASVAEALQAAGRGEELMQAVTDPDYRKSLCAEFGIAVG